MESIFEEIIDVYGQDVSVDGEMIYNAMGEEMDGQFFHQSIGQIQEEIENYLDENQPDSDIICFDKLAEYIIGYVKLCVNDDDGKGTAFVECKYNSHEKYLSISAAPTNQEGTIYQVALCLFSKTMDFLNHYIMHIQVISDENDNDVKDIQSFSISECNDGCIYFELDVK